MLVSKRNLAHSAIHLPSKKHHFVLEQEEEDNKGITVCQDTSQRETVGLWVFLKNIFAVVPLREGSLKRNGLSKDSFQLFLHHKNS